MFVSNYVTHWCISLFQKWFTRLYEIVSPNDVSFCFRNYNVCVKLYHLMMYQSVSESVQVCLYQIGSPNEVSVCLEMIQIRLYKMVSPNDVVYQSVSEMI